MAFVRQALVKEHPQTLRNMNDLANVLQEQREQEEAEQLCQKTLELRGKVPAPEGPLPEIY